MSYVSGKALVVFEMEGLDYKGNPTYDVQVFIQSMCGVDHNDPSDVGSTSEWIQEEFSFLRYNSADSFLKGMEEGDKVRVAVSYSCSSSCDYWGEWDTSIEWHKVRVLRRQKAKPYYYGKKKQQEDIARALAREKRLKEMRDRPHVPPVFARNEGSW